MYSNKSLSMYLRKVLLSRTPIKVCNEPPKIKFFLLSVNYYTELISIDHDSKQATRRDMAVPGEFDRVLKI